MKLEFIRKRLEELNADAFVVLNHEASGQPDTAYVAVLRVRNQSFW